MISVCASGIPFVGCDCVKAEAIDRCMHLIKDVHTCGFQVVDLVWS